MFKKNPILYLFIIIFVLFLVFIIRQRPQITTPYQKYDVILANTEELRVKGLSNRKYLEKNKVMLFVFDKSDVVGIWMKDMLFNIDIVYVDETWKVVNYFDDVSPSTYPNVYYSEQPVRYVIEMNSGERKKSGIDKGVQLYYK